MSVRKSERTEGRLKVLGEARNLCAYTLQICKNEKVIPKSQRWLMTQRIVGETLDAMICISRANSYPLDDIVGSFLRHAKQTKRFARGCVRGWNNTIIALWRKGETMTEKYHKQKLEEARQAEELRMQATIDYNVMMGNLDDPNAEVTDDE